MDDNIRDRWHTGRRAMISAFAELTAHAMGAGVDQDLITDLHGRFFDGNVATKDAFRVAVFLAELRRPPTM